MPFVNIMIAYLCLDIQENKNESFSNFFVPSHKRKEQQEQNHATKSGSHNSNYISFKRDDSTPLATARSNASYDDTPRGRPVHNIRAGFLRVETKPPAHILQHDRDQQIQDKAENGSALQHWLSDTDRKSQNQASSCRPGIPVLEPGPISGGSFFAPWRP